MNFVHLRTIVGQNGQGVGQCWKKFNVQYNNRSLMSNFYNAMECENDQTGLK